MNKVTSTKTIDFPKFRWGITAGEERELPEAKEAQEAILAHPAISEVGGKSKSQERRETVQKESKKEVETKEEGNDE